MDNAYCDALGIEVPILETVVGHKEASTYALLLVALLEQGRPMTLDEVAARLSRAGLGPAENTRRSLQKSRPDRPPVYRHGDLYHLDAFDDELSLWAFRLDLRPPRGGLERDGLDVESVEERMRRLEARKEAAAAQRAELRRAVVRAFPNHAPAAVALLNVDSGSVERFAADALDACVARLDKYDVLAGEEIRPALIGLGMDVDGRRLHELRPAQKTITANRRGGVLTITMEHLLRGSCGYRRQWGRTEPHLRLLAAGKLRPLLDLLEEEVVALAALYHYGRVHGAVRLRWRRLDERLRAHWVAPFDEWTEYDYIRRATKSRQPLEVVAGTAPDPTAPWAGAEWCSVFEPEGYLPALVTAGRRLIQIDDVQRLRMARPGAWHAPLPSEAAGPSTAAVGRPTGGSRDERILRIRVTLQLEDAPPVWRVIELPADASFWDLHVAIQDVMGWQDYHLHAFRLRDATDGALTEIGIPVDDDFEDEFRIQSGWQIPVLRHLNGQQPDCEYKYDFGDSWIHNLHLEATAPADPACSYPRCVEGARACPPEDVGGPVGYDRFLAAIADPAHEEHDSNLVWVGGTFEPGAFDPSSVSFTDPGERWVESFGVDSGR